MDTGAGRIFDCVVVGAGAAGIAAGRALRAGGADFLIVEARPRIGGRTHTIDLADDLAADLGAEWLHSADVNPMVGLARSLGHPVLDESPDWSGREGRLLSARDLADFNAAAARFWRAADAPPPGPDRAVGDLLAPEDGRWRPLLDAISSWYCGAELDKVSAADLAAYEDTRVNWRLGRGYGALMTTACAGLPVRLSTPVREIDHSGTSIRVSTDAGELRARAVVVTVPAALLAGEAIRFFPALPEKTEAAGKTPPGLANKIFFSIPTAEAQAWPLERHYFGAVDRTQAMSFETRPKGAPLVSGYVGGEFASQLERAGPQAAEAEARRQIAAAIGADAARGLTFLAATGWGGDPFAQGSYSYGAVGLGNAREILAAPVDDRLFFAGEACSAHSFSTVHGAWETGAGAALRLAARRPPRG